MELNSGDFLYQRRYLTPGFTLVELLIVIIVVSILMSIAIPKFGNQWRSSEEARMKIQIKARREAIERFRIDTGLWPKDHMDIEDRTAPPTGLTDTGAEVSIPAGRWRGPYIDNRLWATGSRHPLYRNTNLAYSTTPPNVGFIKFNTSQITLSGENIGTW